MSGAPDLTTPEGRDAYRSELRGVARVTRTSGVALALAGAALGVTRFFVDPWPDWMRWSALVLCVLGVALITTGFVQRTRYHLRRLAGG
jgi:membrane protein YdbS with pleckstrin-like domain